MLPNLLLQTLSGTVLYPLLARLVRTSRSMLPEKLAEAREILLSLGLFCVTGVVLEAEPFFALLYNDRYAGAGAIAQLLSLGVWATIVSNSLERALQALGDTRSLAAFNLTKVVIAAAAALGGFHVAGLPGFIVGYAIGTACGHLMLLRCLAAHGIAAWREDVRMTALAALAIAIGWSLADAAIEYGVVVRELATWSYLGLLGAWALAQSRRLKGLQD
jgi:O-antigen/teichoic acid export membrane protein